MSADFYLLEISNGKNLMPNDLPALLEVPVEKFLKMEFAKKNNLRNMDEYIRKNENFEYDLPEQYALMIPNEVRKFLSRGDVEK